MESWPKITVITVVRNARTTLEHAIQSVLAQNYPNLEYFVLDGGSTDGTQDIIERYRKYIAHTSSGADGGPNAAYNAGIARATGEIIALLNADDWYESEILREVGKAFRAQPELDMVTCEARIWRKNVGGTLDMVRAFTGHSLNVTPLASPVPNARFFKRDVFARFGDFLVTNHRGERMIASDLEFLLRLSEQQIKNHVLHRQGYNYLMHEGSITMSGDAKRDRQMYDERTHLAKTYLARGKLKRYARRLKRWHRRGTVRAFWRALRMRHGHDAWHALKEGVAVSGALWLADALRVGISGKA